MQQIRQTIFANGTIGGMTEAIASARSGLYLLYPLLDVEVLAADIGAYGTFM